MNITPADIKARRLALGLTQTAFADAIIETHRIHRAPANLWNKATVAKIEAGGLDKNLLAVSLTLQRLEAA